MACELIKCVCFNFSQSEFENTGSATANTPVLYSSREMSICIWYNTQVWYTLLAKSRLVVAHVECVLCWCALLQKCHKVFCNSIRSHQCLPERAGAGSNCIWDGAVTKDITAPSVQHHHAPCFWDSSTTEHNEDKGGQEGPAPWHTQLPRLHPWQALHHMLWAWCLCFLITESSWWQPHGHPPTVALLEGASWCTPPPVASLRLSELCTALAAWVLEAVRAVKN